MVKPVHLHIAKRSNGLAHPTHFGPMGDAPVFLSLLQHLIFLVIQEIVEFDQRVSFEHGLSVSFGS